MKEKERTIKDRQMVLMIRNIGAMIFLLVLIAGGALGAVITKHPKVSKREGRELTKFPSFSAESFWNGDYFAGISTWYSDTYPMRDTWIDADKNIKSLYGLKSDTQMIGGTVESDEIPDVITTEVIDVTATNTDTPTPTTEEVTTEEQKKVDEPDSMAMETEIQKQIQQGLYIKDGAAYSVYYFVKDSADRYIAMMNRVANELDGQTNVYSILVPNNSGVMLSEDELNGLGGSNQGQAINYYYQSYNSKVKTVDIYEKLRSHNNEYLFFRSDHHWTQLAAYYTYEEFCKQKGITPTNLSDHEKREYTGFLGSAYATVQNDAMAANPDVVEAYLPIGTNSMTYYDRSNTETNWFVVSDVSEWSENSKYACFVGGDQPLCVIENPNITDGSSCAVVKESYGNCLVPFLVDHYQTVYVIDFRYTKQNVLDFVKEKKVDDLIVINNISIIGNTDVSKTMDGLFK